MQKIINIVTLAALLIFINIPIVSTSTFLTKAKLRKKGNAMIIGMPGLPQSLDPLEIKTLEHYLILQCLTQTLIRISEDGQLVADLAEHWHFEEGGKILLFNLKSNSRFSDGTPVTTVDVATSLKRHFSDNSKSAVAGYLDAALENKSESIIVKSNSELQLKLKAPYAPLLHVLSMPGFGIISKEALKKNKIIGSGPFIIDDQKAQSIYLKPNSHYQLKKNTPLTELTIIAVNGAEEAHSLFEKEVLDIYLGSTPSEIVQVKWPNDVKVTPAETLAIVHLYFNTKNHLFNNVSNRKIISSALRNEIWRTTNIYKYDMFLNKQNSFIPNGVLPKTYYSDLTKVFNDEATPLGKIEAGRPINVVLVNNIFDEHLRGAVEKSLLNIGIRSKIVLTPPQKLPEYLISKNYDIIGGRYIGNFPDPDGYLDVINQESPLHYGVFSTAQFFKIINKIRFTADPTQRLENYSQALVEFEKQINIIPLFRLLVPIVHRSDILPPPTNFRYEGELWRYVWKNL